MKKRFILILGVVCTGSFAQALEVSRVLKTFDFEERRLGNVSDLPMGWNKVSGAGLPHYVTGKLVTDRRHGGQYSFRFDLDGGGLIYRYAPGQIKVQQGARYRIEGYCLTTPLPNARARITAYFVDKDGHSLDKTIQRSQLYAASSDPSDWQKLSVSLTDESPQADSLVIELQLLQPAQYSTSSLGDHALYDEDIHGSAWWDDITVAQVPAIGMRTGRPENIFHSGEPIRISLLIGDKTTEDLVAHVSVRDAEGKEVYQRTGTPEVLTEASTDGLRRILLDLPKLLAGWYEVRLGISSHGQLLENEAISLAVLADGSITPTPDARFGMIATSVPFNKWRELPGLLKILSAGRVKLPVWSDLGDVEQSHGMDFDEILHGLNEAGVAPTACFISPPRQLRNKLRSAGWSRLYTVPAEQWRPDLAFVVSRNANRIARWQLGPDGTDAFVNESGSRDAYKRVYDELSRLVPDPDLAVSWPAYYELPADAPADIALDVPTSILPSQIPLYMQEIKGKKDRKVSLTLRALDRARYGRKVQIRDLAQRIVYALSADAPRIDFPLPLTEANDDVGVASQPDELFVVLHTILSTLSGTTYRGRVVLSDGIDAFLFDRGAGDGIIALWSRGDPATPHELTLNLGERPIRLDLWGNAAPLLQTGDPQNGRVLVNVGTMPIFLLDIDGRQAQLRSSVAIDQPLLESSFRQHERRIRFTNTYDHAISGTLHVRAPAGWTLNPPTFNFNLNPGETFTQPLTILFPYNSVAGEKLFKCEFVIMGDRNVTFGVPLVLRLGLSDVGMQTFAIRDGHDIFVQQMVTNYSEKPINYGAFATYPGQARQERVVMNLAPGATTIRRYRFHDVPITHGGAVRAGLIELEGTRILNDVIEVQ